MTAIFYGIIIFAACAVGSYIGLGGGVIIKPLLDLIGKDAVSTVNFISACSVFCMSISSVINHIKLKSKFDIKLILLISFGSIVGGAAGSGVFNKMLDIFNNDMLKSIQGLILGILLVFSAVYVNLKNAKSFNLKNMPAVVILGLLLGFTASFLGIGGGPINMAFLVLMFSMSVKEASVYSVGIIFFSQLAKLITMGVTDSVPEFNAAVLVVCVICSVIGGIVGTRFNKKSNEKRIKVVFSLVVAALAIVNFYNAASGFIAGA